jgi:hypothetical protein
MGTLRTVASGVLFDASWAAPAYPVNSIHEQPAALTSGMATSESAKTTRL